jgi:hypothetical protein
MADQNAALMALAGTKPAGDRNGLADPKVVEVMLDDENKLVLCVGLVTNHTTVKRNRSGKIYPVIEWCWIEVAAEEDEHYQPLGEILNTLYMKRTGAMMAPFIPGGQRPLDVPDDDEETETP